MNIKEEINKLIEKLSKDDSLLEKFKKDPVKTVESLIGIDLPDDVVEQIVTGIKAHLTKDKIADVAASFKKLF